MYGKYFASTFTGSMVGAGSTVFAVWGYVIANCRNGSVELNPRLLAMILGDSSEKIQTAVNFLCSPDSESRTKEHDGCRMIHQGAFLYDVPNHSTYRKILNEDERRAYFRDKKREERQKKKALTIGQVGQSKTVKDMSTVSTHSEADADGEKEENWNGSAEPSAHAPDCEPLLVFPCNGPVSNWALSVTKLSEWRETYPGLDVETCARKAWQWAKDNPRKRKTSGGMTRFLGTWFATAQNKGECLLSEKPKALADFVSPYAEGYHDRFRAKVAEAMARPIPEQ